MKQLPLFEVDILYNVGEILGAMDWKRQRKVRFSK
jgi:hypothetical protein